MRAANATRGASAALPRWPVKPIKYTTLQRIVLDSASKVVGRTLSGGSNTGTAATDTTAPVPGGQLAHIRFTNVGTNGSAYGITLTTPWDFITTPAFFRYLVRSQLYSNQRNIKVCFATSRSALAAGNYLYYDAKPNSSQSTTGNWFVPGVWVHDSIALENCSTAGTAPALSSIGYIEFQLQTVSGQTNNVDLADIALIAKGATKAKCVIWHDDLNPSGGTAMLGKLNAYSFPACEAAELEMFDYSSYTFATTDIATYHAAGWQFASHATTANEHTNVPTASVVDQARRNRLAAVRKGLGNESADFTYWGGLQSALAFESVQRYYRSGRWNTSGLAWPDTQPPAEPAMMKAQLVATGETFAANWQPLLNAAIASGGIAQYVFHQDVATNSATATEFDNLLAFLNSNRASIDVVTIATVLNALS